MFNPNSNFNNDLRTLTDLCKNIKFINHNASLKL